MCFGFSNRNKIQLEINFKSLKASLLKKSFAQATENVTIECI